MIAAGAACGDLAQEVDAHEDARGWRAGNVTGRYLCGERRQPVAPKRRSRSFSFTARVKVRMTRTRSWQRTFGTSSGQTVGKFLGDPLTDPTADAAAQAAPPELSTLH